MENRYYIKSLSLAAWISAHDIELVDTEKTDNGYHLFWFEDTPALHECVDDYYKQDALQKYIKALIQLKKVIHKVPQQ